MPYQPENPPQEASPELAQYILDELRRVAAEFNLQSEGEREVVNVVPPKPRTGQIVYADGTNWNPGGGAGTYEYTGGGTNGWRMLATGTQY